MRRTESSNPVRFLHSDTLAVLAKRFARKEFNLQLTILFHKIEHAATPHCLTVCNNQLV
jgi:hypothetical protein